MTGLQHGINYGVGIFVADRLGTCFVGDTYGITFGFENILRVLMMEILRVM